MENTIACTTCGASLAPVHTRCPRCDAVAPTRPPVFVTQDELIFEPSAEAPSRAWLCVVGTQSAFEIDRPLVVGRGTGADLRLPGPTISRRHALVLGENGVFRVLDLGSRNGVYVNEERITEERLDEGDVIRIADFELVVTFVEPTRTPPPVL